MRYALCLLILTACGEPVTAPPMCRQLVAVTLNAQGDTLGYAYRATPCTTQFTDTLP